MNLVFAGDFVPTEDVTIDSKIKESITDSDYSFVNLETPLTNSENPIPKNGNNFKVSPKLISKIKEFGFNGVTLANNHIRDYSNQGVLDTIELCEQEGLYHVGAGETISSARKPLRLEKDGLKVSIINIAEQEFNIATANRAGANPYDTIVTFYAIQEEKKVSDKVIVVYHGGVEYIKYPAPYIVKEFKFMIDAGADAIISHHTHRYSGIIEYKSKPIAFGLGNFFMQSKNRNQPKEWYRSVLLDLELQQNSISFSYHPIELDDRNMDVRFLKGHEAEEVIKDINHISEDLETPEKLQDIWHQYFENNRKNMAAFLKSNSKTEYRVRKRLPYRFSKLSEWEERNLKNILRCQAHSYRFLKHLDKYYKNR